MTIPFEEYLTKIAILDEAVDDASAKLQSFPKGDMGLTPDDVKASPEFKEAKNNYDRAFRALRKFNGTIPNTYKRKRSLIKRAAKA